MTYSSFAKERDLEKKKTDNLKRKQFIEDIEARRKPWLSRKSGTLGKKHYSSDAQQHNLSSICIVVQLAATVMFCWKSYRCNPLPQILHHRKLQILDNWATSCSMYLMPRSSISEAMTQVMYNVE
jgi:hypothetical protein